MDKPLLQPFNGYNICNYRPCNNLQKVIKQDKRIDYYPTKLTLCVDTCILKIPESSTISNQGRLIRMEVGKLPDTMAS
jgi:hypothetical protein